MHASAFETHLEPSEDRAVHPAAPDLVPPPAPRPYRTWGEGVLADLGRARRALRLMGKQREKLLGELADLGSQLAAARAIIAEDHEQGVPAIRRALEREADRLGVRGAKARAVLGAVLAELANLHTSAERELVFADQVRNSLARVAAGDQSPEAALETIGGTLRWRDVEVTKLADSRRYIAVCAGAHKGGDA